MLGSRQRKSLCEEPSLSFIFVDTGLLSFNVMPLSKDEKTLTVNVSIFIPNVFEKTTSDWTQLQTSKSA